jgi:rod shape determining protein RodA
VDKTEKIFKTIDWPLVLIYMLLVIFGWLNIYAAVYNEEHKSIVDLSQRYGKQLLWISISFVIIFILFFIDSRAYEYLSYPIYLVAIFMLIAVLVFGTTVKSSRSWFEIAGLRIQPAEFAKVATALVIARIISIYDFNLIRFNDFVKVTGVIIVPFLLILLQNDTGSALVYSAFVIVLYRMGLSPWYLALIFVFGILFIISLVSEPFWVFLVLPVTAILVFHLIYKNNKYTLIGILVYSPIGILLLINNYFFKYSIEVVMTVGILIATVSLIYPSYKKRLKYVNYIAGILVVAIAFTFSVEYIFHNVLEKHQRTRINVLLGLESDPRGVEYNVNQSKIAIGSGEITGKGYLQGTQTKYNFVPEQDTDFIFCTVGEEWGFVGSTLILVLFAILILRIIYVAERQKTKFNLIYGYCVASIFFFHVAINIGMTIGLVPVIGIPLPFFSYGGSSLWAFTILLFILLKLDSTRYRKF